VSCAIQGLKELLKHPNSAVLHHLYRYEHDTFRPLSENSSELAGLISERVHAQRLLIVAHSRGGLVARLALDDLSRRGYRGQVELYTFGTPHQGTPLVQIGGKALNLLYKLGEDIVGSLPHLTPLTKAYSYLIDSPTLPRGIDVMREDSDVMDLLRRLNDPAQVRSYGSDFDIRNQPSGFGIVVEGALSGAFDGSPNDLVVPTGSSLGFGTPQQALTCSHVHYFSQPSVCTAIQNFCEPPDSQAKVAKAPRPDHITVGGVRFKTSLKSPRFSLRTSGSAGIGKKLPKRVLT
jgi:hypothetical protein